MGHWLVANTEHVSVTPPPPEPALTLAPSAANAEGSGSLPTPNVSPILPGPTAPSAVNVLQRHTDVQAVRKVDIRGEGSTVYV